MTCLTHTGAHFKGLSVSFNVVEGGGVLKIKEDVHVHFHVQNVVMPIDIDMFLTKD